jgi:integrase
MKKRVRFPLRVKRGSSSVKIYRDRKPQGTYYRVVYHLGGKRHRLNFSDLDEARTEAEAKASHLSQGHLDAALIKPSDRLELGRARHAVKEFDLPLDAVAIEYKQARNLLDGVPLLDAARFYVRHHSAGLKRKSVAAALDELLLAKKRKGVSDVYLHDLRSRLGRFAQSFQCDLSAIAPADVASFFEHLGLSPRSHNNFLRVLSVFFSFAQRHDYLSREVDLLSRVEQRNEKGSPIEIFTPSELGLILGAASPHLAACLALGAFGGLRTAEILRLEWADTERHPGFIEVAAHKAKTATRRIVPIADNLGLWLSLAPRQSACVWPYAISRYYNEKAQASSKARLSWKCNGLRHSFISYRLALLADVNRVALEAGNSPSMIFRHYRELCTPDQAKSWFSIAPSEVPNVVPFATA